MLLVAPVLEGRRVPISSAQLVKMSRYWHSLRQRVKTTPSVRFPPSLTSMTARAYRPIHLKLNRRFQLVMEAFCDLTGCPVLVNTSFKRANKVKPIVCTPEDAYRCFLATEMDVLVLEDFILLKSQMKVDAGHETRRAEYLAQFQLD